MKKKLLFVALLLCATTLCFAERRYKAYTYRNYTVKIVWDDNHVSGPPDKNMAQVWYNDATASWESVICYRYELNPKHGRGTEAGVSLYDSGYGWYKVVFNYFNDGLWEKVYDQDFSTYNQAYNAFSTTTDFLETLIK